MPSSTLERIAEQIKQVMLSCLPQVPLESPSSSLSHGQAKKQETFSWSSTGLSNGTFSGWGKLHVPLTIFVYAALEMWLVKQKGRIFYFNAFKFGKSHMGTGCPRWAA